MRSTTPRNYTVTPGSTVTEQARLDRLLISLGCDPAFVSDFLGDLRQEYADRAARDRRVAASLWYAREILRSTPHLAWSAVRDGTPTSRARLAAYLLAGIATLSVVTIAWAMRAGPPARLVNEAASLDGMVINHVSPVRLTMTVMDASGKRLQRSDVRYERLSGIGIPVSSAGVAKCTARGDAVIRATLGALKTDFIVHCEPVAKIRGAGWGNFLVGDSARTLEVDAVGLDGQPVTRIAARLSIVDSTVATLDGSALRPLRVGSTPVEIDVGNEESGANVTVFEPLRSLAELRPDQRWVAVRVHLKRGESVTWPLPTGLFFLAFSTDTTTLPSTRSWGSSWSPHPDVNITVDGPIMCMPEPARAPGVMDTHCLARGPGATLTIRHAGARASDVVGMLAFERQEQR